MSPLTRQPGSNLTRGTGVVLGPGRYGVISATVGAPPGAGLLFSTAGSPRDLRTEYSSPRTVVDTGKHGLPSCVAFLHGSSRASSIRFTTRSTESLTGRAGGDADGDGLGDGEGEGGVAARTTKSQARPAAMRSDAPDPL